MYPTGSCQKYGLSTAGKRTRLKDVEITTNRFAVHMLLPFEEGFDEFESDQKLLYDEEESKSILFKSILCKSDQLLLLDEEVLLHFKSSASESESTKNISHLDVFS